MKFHTVQWIALIFWLSGHVAIAQQVPVVHHQLYNPQLYNPAFTGLKGSGSVLLAHRQQWMGFEDAPNTTFLSGNFAPFGDRPFGLGVNFSHDQRFALRRSALNIFPSIHIIEEGEHLLSFGINLGVINHGIDYSVVQNPSIPTIGQDPLLTGGSTTNEWMLDAGLGLGYQYEKGDSRLRLGATITQLTADVLYTDNGQAFLPYSHLMVNGSLRLPLADAVLFEPAFLFKQAMGEVPERNSNASDLGVSLEGAELDALLRVMFPQAANLWLGGGARIDVGNKELASTSKSSFWAINGAVGVDINSKLQINVIAETHKYQPFSLEAGIVARLGESTPRPRKSKEPCDPLWRNPGCLDNAVAELPIRPRTVQVAPIIGAREVILIYTFSDRDENYELGKWKLVNSLLAHIQDMLIQLRTGKEPLGSVAGISINEKIQNQGRILDYASVIPYEGEYGSPLSVSYKLDGQDQNYTLESGNMTRKDQEFLKHLTIARTLAPGVTPEINILTDQNINAPREFAVEIRLLRAN